jgi:hypothetical protein
VLTRANLAAGSAGAKAITGPVRAFLHLRRDQPDHAWVPLGVEEADRASGRPRPEAPRRKASSASPGHLLLDGAASPLISLSVAAIVAACRASRRSAGTRCPAPCPRAGRRHSGAVRSRSRCRRRSIATGRASATSIRARGPAQPCPRAGGASRQPPRARLFGPAAPGRRTVPTATRSAGGSRSGSPW